MNIERRLSAVLTALGAGGCLLFPTIAAAGGERENRNVEARSLSSVPESIDLRGRDACRQLLFSAETMDGRAIDLTDAAEFEVVDPKIAKVEPGGRVVPIIDGATEIIVRAGEKRSKSP